MSSFTPLETSIIDVLVNMAKPRDKRDSKIGSFSFFDGGVFYDGIWSTCMAEEMGDTKVYRGVISSLIKKDILIAVAEGDANDGVWLELSESGKRLVAELAGLTTWQG